MSGSLLYKLLVFKRVALFLFNHLFYFGSFCLEHVFQAILLVVTAFSKIDALLLLILFYCGDWIEVQVVRSLIVF
jgi:hypothetical protein